MAALISLISSAASSHSWYDPDCCSDRDCRPVDADDMAEIGGGCWKYLPTGATFCGNRVRPSKDKHWHVCISNNNVPYCAYIQMGF